MDKTHFQKASSINKLAGSTDWLMRDWLVPVRDLLFRDCEADQLMRELLNDFGVYNGRLFIWQRDQ